MAAEPPGRGHPFLAGRLADSAEDRARVEAAERLGISRKRFLGWEPTEVHELVYEDGIHVATVVTRESEWDEQEQAWMLALAVYRAGLCHRCHGELTETASAALDPNNRDGTHFYKARPPKRCHRCTALMASDQTYHAVDKQGHYITPHPQALIHHVDKVARPRRRG